MNNNHSAVITNKKPKIDFAAIIEPRIARKSPLSA